MMTVDEMLKPIYTPQDWRKFIVPSIRFSKRRSRRKFRGVAFDALMPTLPAGCKSPFANIDPADKKVLAEVQQEAEDIRRERMRMILFEEISQYEVSRKPCGGGHCQLCYFLRKKCVNDQEDRR